MRAQWEAERRIGEVQVATGMEHQIVGAVQPAGRIVVGQDGDAAVGLQPRDLPVTVPGEHQPAFRVHGESIGARLGTGERRRSGVPAAREEDPRSLPLLPPVDRIPHHVREQEVLAAPHPHRAFDPLVPVRQLLDRCIAGHQRVEARVE